ncbi:MAG: response regulator [Pseudomonadales bacterium]|nr:response regulator [Pseudomonadales bacterium]
MKFVLIGFDIQGRQSSALGLIAVCLLTLACLLHSPNTNASEYNLANHTLSYKVPLEASPNINDITNLPNDSWSQPSSDTPNFGYTKHTYWFKVELLPTSALEEGRYYYVIDYPVLDSVNFFLISNNEIEANYRTGDTLPYPQRPVESNKFAFPVNIDGTKKTIFVELKTEGTLQLPTKLLSEAEYHKAEFSFYIMEGILVGVIGIMLFYNLSLWYVFRTPEYLYYVLYGISVLTVQLTMLGLSFQYLWPYATWWNNAVIPASMMSTVTFMLLFTNAFLNVATHRPKLSKVIKLSCALQGVLAIASFFMPYEIAIKIAMLSVILFLTLPVATAVGALSYSFDSARLYLISWIGVIGGAVSLALTKFGIVPTNVFTANSWQVGTGIEITLLSFALSSKIKAVTDAKITAEEEAKKANALNAKHLEQYKAIYHNSLEGLFNIDLVNKTIIFNESFAAMNGIEYLVDGSTDEVFIENVMDHLRLTVCTIDEQNKRLRRNEEQVIHSNQNQDKWLAVKRRYLEDQQGNVIGIEGSIVDITDRKLKEKAEVKLIEGLQKADKVKNEFFSTISHELLTPLNGINGHLQLLKDQISDNENLMGIECSSADMLLLINRILNFSQLHADSLTVEPITFKLTSILDPLKDKYRDSCRAKSLAFQFSLEGTIPDLLIGDSRKIFQILDELLSNSIKFTSTGSVGLNVTIQEKVAINDEDQTGISTLSFSVVDTGIGIEKEDSDKVFSLFSQADNSNTRRYGGVGLGLYLSKALSKMLGGELNMVSNPGGGSRFNFNIDLATSQENILIGDSDHPLLDKDEISLLVVEDNAVNQKIMRGILKSLGYQCQIAENGDVALSMLDKEKFHLIFMDCQMPIKDGFETTETIRAMDDAIKDIPIIAVTANAMSGDREHCLSVGMNDFMQKPVKRDAIESSIKHWLKVRDYDSNSPLNDVRANHS